MRRAPPNTWIASMVVCYVLVIYVAFQQWGWVRIALGSTILVCELASLAMYALPPKPLNERTT